VFTLSPLVTRELGHGNVGVIKPGCCRCFFHLDFVVFGGVFLLNPLVRSVVHNGGIFLSVASAVLLFAVL
jgi:hypothetical protein